LIIARFLAAVTWRNYVGSRIWSSSLPGSSVRFFVFARMAARFTQQNEQVRYKRFWLPTLG
jgi:hypothetical protein